MHGAQVVRVLVLELGCHVDEAYNDDGETALMAAARAGHLECARTLIALRADTQAASYAGTYALQARVRIAAASVCARRWLPTGMV